MSSAFRASLPILIAYVPMGIAFGLLFQQVGVAWPWALVSGALVYAGAAQFLSVSFVTAATALPQVFLATLFLNLRHIFYGISFLKRYRAHPIKRSYLAFTLTDETYSLLTTHGQKPDDLEFCLRVSALNHAYWTIGCGLGAFLGDQFSLRIPDLEFVLTALFVVLTIEQAIKIRTWGPFLIGAIGAVFGIFFREQMIVVAATTVFFLTTLEYAKGRFPWARMPTLPD